jgi:hypothetical protein
MVLGWPLAFQVSFAPVGCAWKRKRPPNGLWLRPARWRLPKSSLLHHLQRRDRLGTRARLPHVSGR